MAVTYGKVLRGITLRVGMLLGDQTPVLETTYATAPLTQAELKDGPYPLSVLKDALLMAEEELANAIANVDKHPWRRFLLGQTTNISHDGLIPTTDASSNPAIGVYGSVFDASDSTLCTERPLAEIRRRVRNANSFFRCAVYNFHIDGNRIAHTRTNVKIDVCVYNATTQRTAIDANSNMLLPDSLEEALVCGGASFLPTQNAAEFRKFFDAAIAEIKNYKQAVAA